MRKLSLGTLSYDAKREAKRARDRAYQAKRRARLKAEKVTVPWTAKKVPVVEPLAPQLTNHVALIIDRSGSMGTLRYDVIEQINKQIGNIKAQAYKSKQKTLVSIYTFSSNRQLKSVTINAFPEAVQSFTSSDYYPDGQTALLDAIRDVANDLRSRDDGAKTTSFLMMVLTDGQENDSLTPKHQIETLLRDLQGTDRWTFAMLMPPGGKLYALRLGIPAGNIQEWEGTRQGLENVTYQAVASTASYYSNRGQGMTSTTKFFTDLSGISQRDLNKLIDLTGDFKRWQVKAEEAISDFVESHGKIYEPGKAYYQLTKPEKVQPYKQVVIEDRTNKELYGGDQARKLIGITATPGQVFKLNPGNHANFNLFVQSTSMNRKLVRGTTLLYKV